MDRGIPEVASLYAAQIAALYARSAFYRSKLVAAGSIRLPRSEYKSRLVDCSEAEGE